jgi:hypothetical protein
MKPQAELAAFSRLGGTFVTPAATLVERMRTIRGFVSDWDGVFNQGAKGEGAESTYSEPDSMGTNLLRYALWRKHGKLPIAALITGAENPSARNFAVREVCELLLGLLGAFDAVVASRVAWDRDYAAYFAARQALTTEFVDQRVSD